MTQEEKQLFVKALCGYLPYGTTVEVCIKDKDIKSIDCVKYDTVGTYIRLLDEEKFSVKPYLRPMSSMTEKEYETFPIPYSFDSFSTWNKTILSEVIEGTQILIGIDEITEIIDWLNAHHFDYRGLIDMGLALKAPEGMYDTKTK